MARILKIENSPIYQYVEHCGECKCGAWGGRDGDEYYCCLTGDWASDVSYLEDEDILITCPLPKVVKDV